jgi:hypothetical protein
VSVGASRRPIQSPHLLVLYYSSPPPGSGLVDTRKVVDTLLFERPGASFATNPGNCWLRPGYRTIVEVGADTLWDERAER